jgi:hypothetical protein
MPHSVIKRRPTKAISSVWVRLSLYEKPGYMQVALATNKVECAAKVIVACGRRGTIRNETASMLQVSFERGLQSYSYYMAQ